jgi:hypothetical protein
LTSFPSFLFLFSCLHVKAGPTGSLSQCYLTDGDLQLFGLHMFLQEVMWHSGCTDYKK